jgi:hypothetical protein
LVACAIRLGQLDCFLVNLNWVNGMATRAIYADVQVVTMRRQQQMKPIAIKNTTMEIQQQV